LRIDKNYHKLFILSIFRLDFLHILPIIVMLQ